MTTVQRHHRANWLSLAVAVLLPGCANQSGRAPVPPHYDWPDSFAYRVRITTDSTVDGHPSIRDEVTKLVRFAVRNERYAVWNDSVSKSRAEAGQAPQSGQLVPADTVRFFVRLSRYGAVADVQPDCDPSVAACFGVLPSALQIELRRVIPRLPVWWPPRGHAWADTLRFDDGTRPGGRRGGVSTVSRDAHDTVVAGWPFWRLVWRSERVDALAFAGTYLQLPKVTEIGEVLVDKRTLMPALATWVGALTTPAAATSWRGSARLLGSVFDSTRVRP